MLKRRSTDNSDTSSQNGRALVWARFLQQFGERRLWVGDNEPFLFGATLQRLALRFGSLSHSGAILKEVPRPGVGPGRLNQPPACKAGVSTSYTTGAQGVQQEAPDVGTGGGSNLRPVPASLGPSSAALDLTSLDPPLRSASLRPTRRRFSAESVDNPPYLVPEWKWQVQPKAPF